MAAGEKVTGRGQRGGTPTAIRIARLADLAPDTMNANRGTERGTGMLEASLQRFGAGRSILVDKHGQIIAGNKTAEGAASIGLDEVLLVPTDGTKLVAVQRLDLDLDVDPEARALATADNRISEVSYSPDPAMLAAAIQAGVELGDFYNPRETEKILADAAKAADAALAEPEALELRVYPIPIVVDRHGWERWQAHKAAVGERDDSKAFLALLSDIAGAVGEGPAQGRDLGEAGSVGDSACLSATGESSSSRPARSN